MGGPHTERSIASKGAGRLRGVAWGDDLPQRPLLALKAHERSYEKVSGKVFIGPRILAESYIYSASQV